MRERNQGVSFYIDDLEVILRQIIGDVKISTITGEVINESSVS